MKDYKTMLTSFASSTYEITAGKYPAYLILGQSNAHAYIKVQMQNMMAGLATGALFYSNAQSGKAIEWWYDGSTQDGYNSDIAVIDSIDSAYEVRAIWWIQGETNALTEVTANFDTYTDALLDAYIAYLGYTPDINIVKTSYGGDDAGVISALATINGYQDTLAGTFSGRKHELKHYAKATGDDWHLNKHTYKLLAYDLLVEYAKQTTGAF